MDQGMGGIMTCRVGTHSFPWLCQSRLIGLHQLRDYSPQESRPLANETDIPNCNPPQKTPLSIQPTYTLQPPHPPVFSLQGFFFQKKSHIKHRSLPAAKRHREKHSSTRTRTRVVRPSHSPLAVHIKPSERRVSGPSRSPVAGPWGWLPCGCLPGCPNSCRRCCSP